MRCKAEFFVEPFTEGNPGSHVNAAIGAVTDAGLEPLVGPFGTTIEGAFDVVHRSLEAMVAAAMAAGATRVAITTTIVS